jgi:molybdate transport system substrate-binding protein
MATSPARWPAGLWTLSTRAALLCTAALATAHAAPVTAADDRAAGAQPEGKGLLVFAAASLSEALGDVDNAFTAESGIAVRTSFAASSVLAKQIEAGASADVFVSADREWMDYLEQRALIKPGSRRDLLGNALALIAPADSPVRLKIAPHFGLAAALGNGRLATGDPDSVPAGRYARAALMQLGVWEQVANRLARGENVRAALEYVARGEAPLGIVYRTDAQAEARVRVVDIFPADSHLPVTYPLALTAVARPESVRFAQFLSGDTARQIFVRRGFVVLDSRRPQQN